ncbi:hypothetical protein UA08_04285 [Talaromyces atroroseus]|uniref:Uncharacterized protein n=1 Tax=Talaromyces atroroseus TaxID=1441469 RepID=A0A1Q5Q914_TALAT|nr:hypothetical protein UA08_04285 [Talaromyces atroroseus]OKL60519.1 hypothetical protein UA08_04285 [Talaromyces atroroseus]
MVLLVTTPTILTALQGLSPASREKLGLQQDKTVGSPISHEQLIALRGAFNELRNGQNGSPHTLDSLLRGTQVYIPPAPPKPEPSPEYLALKARLQSLAEKQAYNQLIAPSSTHSNPYGPSPIFASTINDSDMTNNEEEENHDPISPSLVINIFMSILLCGFATFWALKNFQTPSFLGGDGTTAATGKDPVFVLISMFVGILVGVAETVVYASYLRKVRQAKDAEKRLNEKKEVVSSEVLSNLSNSKGHEDGFNEEVKIWGKGINGGVRRRIRERWENEK